MSYNDRDDDDAFHFFRHDLFPEQWVDLPNILSKTNNNNNNTFDGRIVDVDKEWRDGSEAEVGTSTYIDDNDYEAFYFFFHELFPE